MTGKMTARQRAKSRAKRRKLAAKVARKLEGVASKYLMSWDRATIRAPLDKMTVSMIWSGAGAYQKRS